MHTIEKKEGLGLTKIQNKIFAQQLVWLSKLCGMKGNCFTRTIAEEQIGHFEEGYKGLDFLKAKSGIFYTKVER